MAVLGQCGSANSFSNLPPSIQMDEVTTVAAAYALAGFATDATDMSGSNSNLAATGMANAAASTLNLVNLGTGLAQTSTQGGNGSVPQSEINTLANILAACVNSSGPGSAGCSTLFSNAENNGNPPSDTATAAINIAHNPSANVSALWGLSTSTAPFQPSLSGAPNDWTLAITYSGGSLHGPLGLAIDGNGYVWVANASAFCISQYNSNGVPGPEDGFTGNGAEPSSCGVGITSGGGISGPSYIAFAPSGNIWLANDYDSLTVFDFAPYLGNESFLYADPSSPCTGGGLNLPAGIAFDTGGNAWIPNEGYNANSISEFTSCGSGTSFTSASMDGPSALAIDTSDNIWVANTDGNTIEKISPIGATLGTYYGVESGTAVAIDAGGNVWVTGRITDSLAKFNSGGAELAYSSGIGGLDYPQGIAIDGVGHVWTANTLNNSIGEFDSNANALSGSNGFQGGLSRPQQLAIDPSGNVWVPDYNNGSGNALTEFVGAAAPVVTPAIAALQNNKLGARP
jgi:streptogramin lyase